MRDFSEEVVHLIAGAAVGRRHNHTATARQQAPGTQRHGWATNHQQPIELAAIIAVAICLARNGTARWARHARVIGPKRGCSSSQRSQRGLPLEKQNAASRMNGVVGNKGRKMPMNPSSSDSKPPASQRWRCQAGRSGVLGDIEKYRQVESTASIRPGPSGNKPNGQARTNELNRLRARGSVRTSSGGAVPEPVPIRNPPQPFHRDERQTPWLSPSCEERLQSICWRATKLDVHIRQGAQASDRDLL